MEISLKSRELLPMGKVGRLQNSMASGAGWLLLLLMVLLPGVVQAAVSASLKTSGSEDIQTDLYTTASISPAANTLILAWVVSNDNSAIPPAPTLSGNSLTWVQVNNITFNTGSGARLTLFRAMGAAPSTGAVTITHSVTVKSCAWTIVQFIGVDTSGANGSGAVVQSISGMNDSAGTSGISLSLAALQSGSATAGGFANAASWNTAISAGSGYTALNGASTNNPSSSIRAEWRASGSTTVNVSQATDLPLAGIAVEIREGSTFGDTNVEGTLDSGFVSNTGAVKYTSPANAGTLTAISAYVNASGSDICFALYDESLNKLAQGCGGTSSGGWRTINVSYALTPNTVYWLGFSDGDGGYSYRYTTTALANQYIERSVGGYSAMPASLSGGTYFTRQYSIYATYTPVPTYTVSGRVFEDYSFSGTAANWDGGTNHSGIGSVDVELYNNSNAYISSTTTAADGTYSFTVVDGTYKVRVRSATIGDSDSIPRGGFNACVPGTCAYPIPTMTLGNAAALYGGQSATTDDTATADNSGPGNTYVSVTVSGGNLTNVNFGLAYNLIVSRDDDNNNATTRSKTGTLRQFIKNANAIGSANGTTANYSQFRMQVVTNQASGGEAWWQITPGIALPTISDSGTTIDGSTQRSNAASNPNSKGPEIEINGGGITASGLTITGATTTIKELTINGFAGAALPDGCGIAVNGASAITIYGNYLGINAVGSAATANSQAGVYVYGAASGTVIGNSAAGTGNIIAGNTGYGIYLAGTASGASIRGNTIGSGYAGTESIANGTGIWLNTTAGATSNDIGGVYSGEGNLIANSTNYGINVADTGSGDTIRGNTVKSNGSGGIYANAPAVLFAKNLIRSNTGPGLYLDAGANGSSVYHNTVNGNSTYGIRFNAGGGTYRNNIITGSGIVGLQRDSGAYTEDHNLITSATTTPANAGGQSNITLDVSDRNFDPFYVNAAGGNFNLIECSSPAINAGLDLAGGQPDLNGATAGLYNGTLPDMGAYETSCAGTSDIAIGGGFSEWGDGTGNEFCLNDQGGADDWTSPEKHDITKFCVATNNSDMVYLLFGFDDTSFSDENPACVLVDTNSPPDGNINYTICATMDGTSLMALDLFSCDNSIPGGCGTANLVKTYPAGNTATGTATGPFGNLDTFVEAGIPFADLGVIGTVVFTSLSSFQTTGLLKKPQDSIFGTTNQDYNDRIQYDLEGGSGNNQDNPLVPSVAGTVYTNEGITSIGAGKTVTLLVNGTVAGSNVTDASGSYYISASMSAADAIMVIIDNDPSYQGNTVTVFNGTNLTNLDIYAGHVITRQDNGGVLTNTNLNSAKGVSADADIIYGVAGGALTVTGSGTKLFIPAGYSFTPGNTITTPALKSYGTFNGGSFTDDVNGDLTVAGGNYTASSGTMYVQGNFVHSGGSFSHNSGTVRLDGTDQTVSGTTTFNNFTKTVASADTLTFQAGSITSINGTATLQGASGQLLSLRSSTPGNRWNFDLGGGAIKAISFVDVKDSDASGSAGSQKPVNPANSLDSHNNIDWFVVYTISGRVFEDANFTGSAVDWDGGGSDKALQSVELELYDAANVLVSTTVTAADGTFTFSDASNGTYKVRARTATVGDSNTPPHGGFTAACALTDPVSGPACVTAAMTWGNGSALYGGQSVTADDTATDRQAGPGNTYLPVTVSGANISGVNFGFAYNLVAHENDSGPGSLRQFMANANGIGSANATTASSSQFRMQTATNQASGGDSWWRITPLTALPTLTDSATTIDGSTQRTNSGIDSNTRGPEIEIYGNGLVANGITVSTAANTTIRELTVDGFSGTGITSAAANALIEKNMIFANSGSDGIRLDAGATGAKLYQNTLHGNGRDGIRLGETGAVIRNNLVTGNAGYGINLIAAAMTESYNGVTDNATTPANALGRSNVALDATDLNVNPLFVNAAGGDFSLTECASPAINQGFDLGGDQPDMNNAVAGLWNNNAPELGALETIGSCAPSLSIVKQAWELNGTTPLASLTAPVGSELVFLIYVRNPTAGPVSDLRINDTLDETAFQYQTGSLIRTSVASPPADNATDLTIFTATAAGTGTTLSDGVDADVASAQNTGGLADIDRITIGAVAGQANAVLTINGRTTFALRFKVKIK